METKKSNRKERYWIQSLFSFIKSRFDLGNDNAQEDEVKDLISKGVEFKGTNLWILIFATFIACLGLNMNNTAVIIGAMLISPLMGPILGVGLSLGINDFELMKRSLRNFGVMVTVVILTSVVYFLLTPMKEARSELLARTVPTVYDVLVAFTGGLAGIIAQTRKDRTSMVIPGVAIATTLLPPLCTVGYGIATGRPAYVLGSFYLLFINIVFIAFAAFFIVRFLKYRKKEFLDMATEKKVQRYMFAVVLITVIPSVVIAYNIIQRTIFESNVDRYVEQVFRFEQTPVFKYTKQYKPKGDNSNIEIILGGEPLAANTIDNVREQRHKYNLGNTDIRIKQVNASGQIDISTLNENYSVLIEEKNKQIEQMKAELASLQTNTLDVAELSHEAGVVVSNIGSLTLSYATTYTTAGKGVETVLVCVVKPRNKDNDVDVAKLAEWLKVRTKAKTVKIYME